MGQENIQIAMVDDRKKRRANIALKFLLIVILICLGITMYNLFYTDAFIENHFSIYRSLWSSIILNWIEIVIIVISIYFDFLPYIISHKFFKKGEYKKQILWGISLFILTQIIAACLLALFTTCMGCYERKYLNEYKIHENVLPCVPNPSIGLTCN